MLTQIQQLWRHCVWADDKILAALRGSQHAVPDAVREYAHIIGAEEVWLARIEGRAARAPVWPAFDVVTAAELSTAVMQGYDAYLHRIDESELSRNAEYVNSAGRAFSTPVGDILLHVALHGQYHRGKVNLLLRQSGAEPAPTDYIAFVRGVPAARTTVPR